MIPEPAPTYHGSMGPMAGKPKSAQDRRSVDTPPALWRYRFLRMNPHYRREWEAAAKRQPGAAIVGGLDPDAGLDPERWGLPYYIDPQPQVTRWRELADLPIGAPRFLDGPTVTVGGALDLGPVGSPCVGVVFDLRREIKPQWEEVRAWMLDYQKQKGWPESRVSHHRPKWEHYLDLLDLDSAGMSIQQIAEEYDYSDPTAKDPSDQYWEQRVRDRLTAAMRLTEPSGYLSIR